MTELDGTAVGQSGRSSRRTAGRARTSMRLVGVAVAVGLCVVTALRVDLDDALTAAAGAGLWSIVAAVALGVPVVAARTLRTHLLLRARGLRVGAWRLTTTQLVGLTFSGLTPGGTGDLVRAWAWRADGVPVETGVAVVAVERVASVLLLVGIGAVLIAPDAGGGPAVTVAIALAGVVVSALPWIASGLLGRGARISPAGRPRPVRALIRVAGQARGLLGSPRVAVGFVGTTIVAFACSGLQIAVLVAGTGGHLGIGEAIAVYCLAQAAGSASGLPFGLGATEAVTVGLLAHLGQPPSTAVAVAMLSRLTVTVPQTLVAALALVLTPSLRRRSAPPVSAEPAAERRVA